MVFPLGAGEDTVISTQVQLLKEHFFSHTFILLKVKTLPPPPKSTLTAPGAAGESSTPATQASDYVAQVPHFELQEREISSCALPHPRLSSSTVNMSSGVHSQLHYSMATGNNEIEEDCSTGWFKWHTQFKILAHTGDRKWDPSQSVYSRSRISEKTGQLS